MERVRETWADDHPTPREGCQPKTLKQRDRAGLSENNTTVGPTRATFVPVDRIELAAPKAGGGSIDLPLMGDYGLSISEIVRPVDNGNILMPGISSKLGRLH
jgi:hypothetical protein